MTERAFVHRGFGGEATPADIAPSVILVPSRAEAAALAASLDGVRRVADHYAWEVWTGAAGALRVTVVSTGTGSSSAAIAIEELAVLGARTLIGLAVAGRTDVPDGAVLVAEGAVRLDAASGGYVRSGFPAVPDPGVVLAGIAAARSAGATPVGTILADVDVPGEDLGVPSPRGARALAIASVIRETGAVAVRASPAVLFVAGTVHGLRTGFLAIGEGPGSMTRLGAIAIGTLERLAGSDGIPEGVLPPIPEPGTDPRPDQA